MVASEGPPTWYHGEVIVQCQEKGLRQNQEKVCLCHKDKINIWYQEKVHLWYQEKVHLYGTKRRYAGCRVNGAASLQKRLNYPT